MRVARDCGFESRLNHPFAGGHIVEHHGSPARGVHAIQVEIDRVQYLDSTLSAPGPGFDRCADLLKRLAQELGEALLNRRFATAAE